MVALSLLRRVRERAEKLYVHGRFLSPIVLRAEGRDIGNKGHILLDHYCTFLNFPYFSLQAPSPPPQQNSTGLHPARGLMQSFYHFESTKVRDEEQAIC
jgi:hypothetical protein